MDNQRELFEDDFDDSLLEQVDLGDVESSRFPAILAEMNALLQVELKRLGYDPVHALRLVRVISENFGGIQFYLPRGQVLESLIRDMSIWRDFNGKNVNELASHYQVTFKTVYKAIKRMRMIEGRKRQPDLFGEDNE